MTQRRGRDGLLALRPGPPVPHLAAARSRAGCLRGGHAARRFAS